MIKLRETTVIPRRELPTTIPGARCLADRTYMEGREGDGTGKHIYGISVYGISSFKGSHPHVSLSIANTLPVSGFLKARPGPPPSAPQRHNLSPPPASIPQNVPASCGDASIPPPPRSLSYTHIYTLSLSLSMRGCNLIFLFRETGRNACTVYRPLSQASTTPRRQMGRGN